MIKDSKATNETGMLLSFIPTGEYYFTKGLKAFQRRELQLAKKYMQRALQLEPGEPMIACQLAIVSTEMGEYEQSNRILHEILEDLDGDMVECHYFLANNYAHLGFFKDAYHHANLYIQLDPDGEFTSDTEDLIELLSFESDLLDDELYEQDDLMVKHERARDFLEEGNFKKAIELLKEVIKEYPEYWSAYNNLALSYFYLGQTEKAYSILKDVLEKNPGNLHALCNRAIFAYYQHNQEQITAIKSTLAKINPMHEEHQFKLGATFALIGEYELGHFWLRKLYKKGFNGDGSFYYWLSYTAFYSGHPMFAKSIWKIVLELSPDKEGHEPWNEEMLLMGGLEDHIQTVVRKLESEHTEERLFALFLTAISSKKEQILNSLNQNQLSHLTSLESDYFDLISQGNIEENSIHEAHKIGLSLFNHHQPIGTLKSGIYLLWFSVFQELVKSGVKLQNHLAWAASIEYIWYKLRGERISQTEVATKYEVSLSTVKKYVKIVNSSL